MLRRQDLADADSGRVLLDDESLPFVGREEADGGSPNDWRPKMLKKCLAIGTLGVVTAGAVAGTGAWSYVKTGVHSAKTSMRDSMPVEWEIKRARQMIDELEPEIQDNMLKVTREKVEVSRLADQIEDKADLLASSRGDIMRLRNDLESGAVEFVYRKKSYSEDQVKDELKRRFSQFVTHQATNDKLEKILSARTTNLHAATAKLDEMLSAKRELEVRIEELEARLTLVGVAEASSHIAVDDSLLSNTRQLLDDISTRIEVKEQLVASAGSFQGSIQLDDENSPELLEEIAEYFGEGDAEVKTLLSSHEL